MRINYSTLFMSQLTGFRFQSVPDDYYNKMTASDLQELPFVILESFFRHEPTRNINLDRFEEYYNLTGFKYWEYGNLLHDTITSKFDEDKVKSFINDLIFAGYNVNLKYGDYECNFFQAALIESDYNEVFLESVFTSLCESTTVPFDINAKNKNGNSIIHTAIRTGKSLHFIFFLLITMGFNFDIECKNNANLNILEMWDRYRHTALDQSDRKRLEKVVNSWVEVKRKREKNKLEKQNHPKTEEEKKDISKKVMTLIKNNLNLMEIDDGKIYKTLSLIVNDMEYIESETTGKSIFSQEIIDFVYVCISCGSDERFCQYRRSALKKIVRALQDEDHRKKELLSVKTYAEEIEGQAFMDIIENRNHIFELKENLAWQISWNNKYLHLKEELKENFDSVWSRCEEKLKQTIRTGIINLQKPIDSNTFHNILQALEEYGFREEIDFLNEYKDKVEIVSVEKETSKNEQEMEKLLDQMLELCENDKVVMLNKMKEYIEKLSESDKTINGKIEQKEHAELIEKNNSQAVTTSKKVKQKKKC